MLSIQRVAAISGIIFVLVSLLGFVMMGTGTMQMAGSSGMLLGYFPVNALHNLVHGLFGIWGLVAARSAKASLIYTLGSGAAYLLLGILGLFTDSLLGMVPIGGYDVVLHLVLAIALAGCGFWSMWFVPQRRPVSA
jgi:hypothetical protein